MNLNQIVKLGNKEYVIDTASINWLTEYLDRVHDSCNPPLIQSRKIPSHQWQSDVASSIVHLQGLLGGLCSLRDDDPDIPKQLKENLTFCIEELIRGLKPLKELLGV